MFAPALAKAPSSDPLPSLSVARVTLTGVLGLFGPRVMVSNPSDGRTLVGKLRSYTPYAPSRIRARVEEVLPGAVVTVYEQTAQDKLERVYLVTVRLADGGVGGPREAVRS